MTEEQRERHREAQRRYRERNPEKNRATQQRYRANNPDKVAAAKARYRQENPEKFRKWRREHVARDHDRELFRGFVYRQNYADEIAARDAVRRAADPEKFKAQNRAKQQRRNLRPRTERERERDTRRARLRHIAQVSNRQALAARIVANVEAVVPRTLPADVRGPVVAAMVAAVYAGELPIRPAAADAKTYTTEHFRLFTKFGPESLDAPRFDDGRGSLHDTISEGLWS